MLELKGFGFVGPATRSSTVNEPLTNIPTIVDAAAKVRSAHALAVT